jgi:hypothetical protein
MKNCLGSSLPLKDISYKCVIFEFSIFNISVFLSIFLFQMSAEPEKEESKIIKEAPIEITE